MTFLTKRFIKSLNETNERGWKTLKNGKTVLFTILASMMLICVSALKVAAQGTQISVIPASQIVGEEGIEPPTDPFVINITLTDFIDVYTWQIRILFDPALLNVSSAIYPADHIFAGKTTAPAAPIINNAEGYVLFGNTLVGAVPGIDGTSAVLCQIEIRGIRAGVSSLTFRTTGAGSTFILDSEGLDITYTANNGEVTVIPELSSALLAIFFIVTIVMAVAAKTCSNKRSKSCSRFDINN